MTFELGPKQKAWIAALRSGEYAQDTNSLKTDRGYCCLGVACEVLGVEFRRLEAGSWYVRDGGGWSRSKLPQTARAALGLEGASGEPLTPFAPTLASLNDSGVSFLKIADLLERSPETYFTGPA